MINDLLTLGMLIFLQAVLGFDNLLYISLESKRVAPEHQKRVRRLGIGLAIFLRIALLFILVKAISAFQKPINFMSLQLESTNIEMTGHALIVLGGGLFILYTAVKEISHMLSIQHLEEGGHEKTQRSPNVAIAWILVMNLVFSFDSILSAIALTDVFWVMATAIIISGVLMIALADHVAEFLKKNRLYEVLGLFILFIVGIMLISEGAHLAKMKFFGHEIHAMAKSTFYFSIACLVLVDLVQGRYQKKINHERADVAGAPAAASETPHAE